MKDIVLFGKEFFSNIISSDWNWDLVGINIILMTMFLIIFKFMIGSMVGVKEVNNELSVKDNPAFGSVMASYFISFFIIMAAASSGSIIVDYKTEALLMISYGLSGIIMLLLSNVIFDKIIMNSFCINQELKQGNEAAALMASGNTIATALIIFAYMLWVKGSNITTIVIVSYGWVVSQLLLSALSYFRFKLFKCSSGKSLQDAIKEGNKAVAMRNVCYRLSIALTPFIASSHIQFITDEALWQATMIFVYSIILSVLLLVLSFCLKYILFSSINFKEEINEQNNTGLAKIEGAIVIGLTIVMYCVLK